MDYHKIIIVFLILPLSLIAQYSGKVIKVKDGDTILVLLNNKSQKTIIFLIT